MTWLVHVKMLSRSAFDGLLAVLWPMFFATVTFFLYRAGGDPARLVDAALGASVMGVWSSTSAAAGTALQRQRREGTLELLVAAPAPFPLAVLPVTVAMSSIGLYSTVATLAYGRYVFGIHFAVASPAWFAVAIVALVVSVGAVGFVMALAFVRYRTAWALGAMLELPVWLVCGFLVPLATLPSWVHPVAWVLPPTWGMAAVRAAAHGVSPARDVALCLGEAAVYVAAGVLVAESLLRSARRAATLALT